MSLPLLDGTIGTRLHRTLTLGPFEVHTVECQGRSPLAFTYTATHVTSTVCVVLISSVCGGRCDTDGIRLASSDDIESYAGVVADATLNEIMAELEKHTETVDWHSVSRKADSVAQHPYLGVTVTGVLLQTIEALNDDDSDNKCRTPVRGTLFQMGQTVDVWHLSFGDETICRLASRTSHLLEVPRVTPVSKESLRRQDSKSPRTPLAYLPVLNAFGANAFEETSKEFSLKSFTLDTNSWLLLHSNGFRFAQTAEEKANENRVSNWLPSRLYRRFINDAQFERNFTEVLDHEMLLSAEREARNRAIVAVFLQDSSEPFSHRSHIRAAKYVPSKSRRFETAFARHCARFGADKLKMIALFNEQSGIMAGSESRSVIADLQCDGGEESDTDKPEEDGDDEGESDEEIQRTRPERNIPHHIDCECSECEDDDCYGWSGEPHIQPDWIDE